MLKERLEAAIEAKNNDVNSFVWKFARKSDGTQEEIKLMDATPEQLQSFYDHCNSMLYSADKSNPGRYTLLDIIKDQREKCNVELFLRKLEKGSICADGRPYPRYLLIQDLNILLNKNKETLPKDQLDRLSINMVMNGIPREFDRLSITKVREACLDQLGIFDNKHITFSFILSLGVYLTPEEMNDFIEKDKEGKTRSKLEVIKERLNIKPTIKLTVKPGGLTFTELRAMLNLRPKKYSDLTTDQLTTLRNKVLFRLEQEVDYHIDQWVQRINQILKVAEERGIVINDYTQNN